MDRQQITANILPGILTAVALLCFIWLKLPVIDLPFFWDELGVYAPGALYMVDNGIGVLPANLDPEYSRGHPLFFFFIHALSFELFGAGPLTGHITSLVISLAFLILIYFTVSKWLGAWPALAMVILLIGQPLFYTQSVLVLPEVMLALFGWMSIASWINKKTGWYLLWCSLALMVKETAVVFPVAAAGISFFAWIMLRPLNWKVLWSRVGLALLPFVTLFAFLVVQRMQNGWFFFPYHMDLMSIGIERMITLFKAFCRFFFFLQGRWAYSLVLLVCGILLLVSRQRPLKTDLFNGIWILLFGGFLYSILIFYMSRYTLFMLPFFLLATVWVISALAKKSKMFYLVVPVLAWISISHIGSDDFHVDTDMGYVRFVEESQNITYNVLHELEEGELVFANFPFFSALKDARLGYYPDMSSPSVITGKIDHAAIVMHSEHGPWLEEYETAIYRRWPDTIMYLMDARVKLYYMTND